MDHKIRQIIENSILKNKKQKKEFLLFSRIMIFIQDPLVGDSVNFDEITEGLEKHIPPHLFENIDIIYVGQQQELIDRELEALYDSGAIYITNTLSENIDYIENIIHENGHALEEVHGLSIYGDGKIQREFVGKRERLFHIIKTQGHEIIGLDYSNPEYQQDIDNFLYKELGYDKLNYLINGLFLNPYAVTSISEYFSSGLEKYLLDSTKREQLRTFSPELTKKIEELINGYQN
tara:strand:+ start:445 stop:1146 length:702 start_codon:yes stop_codon:yes gene_type:complete